MSQQNKCSKCNGNITISNSYDSDDEFYDKWEKNECYKCHKKYCNQCMKQLHKCSRRCCYCHKRNCFKCIEQRYGHRLRLRRCYPSNNRRSNTFGRYVCNNCIHDHKCDTCGTNKCQKNKCYDRHLTLCRNMSCKNIICRNCRDKTKLYQVCSPNCWDYMIKKDKRGMEERKNKHYLKNVGKYDYKCLVDKSVNFLNIIDVLQKEVYELRDIIDYTPGIGLEFLKAQADFSEKVEKLND